MITIKQFLELRKKRHDEFYNDYTHREMVEEVYEWKKIGRTLWWIGFILLIAIYFSL